MTEWPQLDDIHRAIRAHDGAASAPDIARHLGKAPTGIGRIIRQALTRGRLVELGRSKTGARCYGIAGEVKP